MNRKARSLILSSTALVLATLSYHGVVHAEEPSELVFTVTTPLRDGAPVGKEMLVEGTAQLPVGHHLWVFARRDDFEPLWWPQGEGKVVNDKWRVLVHFGGAQDINYPFDLAVAAFTEDAHLKLETYRRKAMKTGDSRPIDMPEAEAPQIFHVLKVSH